MAIMCGSEVNPKPSGLSASAVSLLAHAEQVCASAVAAGPVPSPCISVCHMSPDTGWCEGCWRSLDEIGGWGQSSNERKRGVWLQIAQRITSHKR